MGVAVKKSLDFGFDYALYPLALLWLGYFWGGIIMTAASVVLNLMTIRVYDRLKRDWLLLEAIKEYRDKPDGAPNGSILRWILRKGDLAAFFILSWIEDPIIVTLYLRRSAHQYDGLSRRDWMIFWSSTIASNLFWILSIVSVIELTGSASRWIGLY